MSVDPEAEDFDAEALLADLEPLEDLDDAEFGLPPGWLTFSILLTFLNLIVIRRKILTLKFQMSF